MGGIATFFADRVRHARIARAADRLIASAFFEDAEALLTDALRASPNSAALRSRWALAAHNAGRYEEAASRWVELLAIDPHSAVGASGLAANQRELKQLDAARATITPALARHPAHTGIVSEAARIADARYAHDEALHLWQTLAERRDAPPQWRQARDWNLIMLGRLDAAEAAIARACRLQPDHRGHHANRAHLAMARGEWDDAIRLLADYRDRFPDDLVGLNLLGQALEGRNFSAAENAKAPSRATPVAIPRVEDEALRTLLLRFESLGNDCEFGLVQRRYGAEPLGLLRWNKIALPRLLKGLDECFVGLGDPESTTIEVYELEEYRVRDALYGMSMHTFQHRHQVAADVLLARMMVRLRYLRTKLLEDFAAAEKVFVYKAATLRAADLSALHGALRRHGPVRLLAVVPVDGLGTGLPSGLPGEVVALDADLHLGFISRVGNMGEGWKIAFSEWTEICRAMPLDPH